MTGNFRKLSLILWFCLAPTAMALAQHGLELRLQSRLIDLPRAYREDTPYFIEADRVQGLNAQTLEAEGGARFRGRKQSVSADWMRHDQTNNEITAVGAVRMDQGAELAEGRQLRYNLDTDKGVMDNASYLLSPRQTANLPSLHPLLTAYDAHGTAQQIFFEGPGLFRFKQSTYTTCDAGDETWLFHAREMLIDNNKNEGKALDVSIKFMGETLLYSPFFSFPLHAERKSGFLAPYYGSTNTGGLDTAVSFYWNMAPNRDMTITPRLMSRRGLQLKDEFRYLEPNYRGTWEVEYMPNDLITGTNRELVKINHAQNLGGGWNALVDVTKVSDSKYFTDMSTQVALTSQTNLARQLSLGRTGNWGNGGIYSFNMLTQGWQTLQTDPLVPVVAPYSRRPQLTLTAQKQDVLYGDMDLYSSYVDFTHPTLVSGKRVVAYPNLSFPLTNAFAYLTPKVGVHATSYYINPNSSNLSNQTRVLPIFSTESGMTFEKETRYFGQSFIQTLEPKLYYVYIPYRNQSALPNFESGLQDVSLATIYTENQFSGQDRINDANQLTMGVSSRLIDPASGSELLRGTLAQRQYFNMARVSLPSVSPNSASRADILGAVGGRLAPHWTADTGFQYSTDMGQTQNMFTGVKYLPEPGKVLNVAYRKHSGTEGFEQIDFSGQWPLRGRLNVLGRWNYSLPDVRVLESAGGMEYNAGCWAFRVVAHRLATATTAATTAFFIELELSGATRIGSNPLDVLRRSISGYSRTDPRTGRANEYYAPN